MTNDDRPIAKPSQNDRTWALVAHLCVFLTVIPFANILGPFIIWKTKGEDSDFVADQAMESLNFQINVIIAFAVAAAGIFCIVGFILLPIVALVSIVMTIIGGLRAYEGVRYRYPYAYRFLK
ncbi:MAG: DUF4870 domain-containing protein [Planctomycetes bacterium]|nr:DUF4870 domain-containing protein [Planctomycetota bacterium]